MTLHVLVVLSLLVLVVATAMVMVMASAHMLLRLIHSGHCTSRACQASFVLGKANKLM